MSESPFIPQVCEVTLCNKTYTMQEPVRRKSRTMLADAFRIFARYNIELQENGTFNVPNDVALLFVNDVLDWLLVHVDGMFEDKERLDNADDAEVITAFTKVMEFLVRPFKRTQEGTA